MASGRLAPRCKSLSPAKATRVMSIQLTKRPVDAFATALDATSASMTASRSKTLDLDALKFRPYIQQSYTV